MGIRFSKKAFLETLVAKNNLKLREEVLNISDDNIIKKKGNSQEYNRDVFISNCYNKWKYFTDEPYILKLEESEELYFNILPSSDDILRLIYRIPSKELNINRKLNWTTKHKFAHKDKEYGYIKTKHIMFNLGINNNFKLNDKLIAEINYYTSRNIDDDNLDGTFKHMRDGIYLALGVDDKMQVSSTRTLNKIKIKDTGGEYLIFKLSKIPRIINK